MERADERHVPMTVKSKTLQEESWIHLKHTWRGANIHEKVILAINGTLQTSVLIIWHYFYIHSANGWCEGLLRKTVWRRSHIFPNGKGRSSTLSVISLLTHSSWKVAALICCSGLSHLFWQCPLLSHIPTVLSAWLQCQLYPTCLHTC